MDEDLQPFSEEPFNDIQLLSWDDAGPLLNDEDCLNERAAVARREDGASARRERSEGALGDTASWTRLSAAGPEGEVQWRCIVTHEDGEPCSCRPPPSLTEEGAWELFGDEARVIARFCESPRGMQ